MMRTFLRTSLVLLLLGTGGVQARAQEASGPRDALGVTQIRGRLYRFQDGSEHSVFVATPGGIVVVDPLRADTGVALRAYLQAHFPEAPVRAVVVTHHHRERAEGASAFSGVPVIAHSAYGDEVAAERRRDRYAYRLVRDTRDTFDQKRTLAVGDTTVEVVHVGSTHAREMAAVYFSSERVLFAADAPPILRVPFAFDGTSAGDVYRWVDAVAPLAPDLVVFGDGQTMDGSALRELAANLNAVRDAVARAKEQGQSTAQASGASGPLGAAGIGAVYRALRLTTFEASGHALATYSPKNADAFCTATLTHCSAGGAVASGTGALAVTMNGRFGVGVELTLSRQQWTARAQEYRLEESALRHTRFATLFRWGAQRPGRSTVVPVVGLSRTVGDSQGLLQVRSTLLPAGGFHPIATREARLGLTFGMDLAHTTRRGFAISLPLRATRLMGQRPEQWPGLFDVQAGVGISMRVARRVSMR